MKNYYESARIKTLILELEKQKKNRKVYSSSAESDASENNMYLLGRKTGE